MYKDRATLKITTKDTKITKRGLLNLPAQASWSPLSSRCNNKLTYSIKIFRITALNSIHQWPMREIHP